MAAKRTDLLTALGAVIGLTHVVRCDCCKDPVERLFYSEISSLNLCGPCWDREQEETWGREKGIHLV